MGSWGSPVTPSFASFARAVVRNCSGVSAFLNVTEAGDQGWRGNQRMDRRHAKPDEHIANGQSLSRQGEGHPNSVIRQAHAQARVFCDVQEAVGRGAARDGGKPQRRVLVVKLRYEPRQSGIQGVRVVGGNGLAERGEDKLKRHLIGSVDHPDAVDINAGGLTAQRYGVRERCERFAVHLLGEHPRRRPLSASPPDAGSECAAAPDQIHPTAQQQRDPDEDPAKTTVPWSELRVEGGNRNRPC